MEAQTSGSYSAAADDSNSAMEAQASSSYPAAAAAAYHSNSAMEAQASSSYLAAAAAELYKLLYTSCIEAKQNNVAGRDCNCSVRSGSPVEQLSELKQAFTL